MALAIDPDEFMAVVGPQLVLEDAACVARSVGVRWGARQVRELMRHDDADVRATAAMVLGLIGTLDDGAALTDALHDDHACVHDMAEHALWSVWFRCCSGEACEPFHAGVSLMAASDYDGAVEQFHAAHKAVPAFAEAYNQCAIAHYFRDDWKASLVNCRRTLARVEAHFGAILGMGHCYAQMGELDLALSAYRKALAVNPRMPAIADAVARLAGRRRDGAPRARRPGSLARDA